MCRTVVDNGTCPRFCPYRYDFENRLVGLTKGTGSTGNGTYNYTYDYRTRRIVRDESSAGGALTDLVFSGGTSVQEYTGSTTPANLQVEYIRGSDYGGGVGGILYSIRSGTPSYTHENKRGDIIAKTSSTGALTYQAQYEAFGNQTQTAGSTLDRQKSNSKDTDPTGLVDEGFRYRDLETGGFITRDPAGFVDGPNLYTYVVQNPWTSFDPEGLKDQTASTPVEVPAPPKKAPAALPAQGSPEAAIAPVASALIGGGMINHAARQTGVGLTLDTYHSGKITEQQAVNIGENVKNMPLPPVDMSPASGEHNVNAAVLNTQAQIGDAIAINQQNKSGAPGSTPGTATALQNKTETDETVHRIGGGSVQNLQLTPQEKKLNPPGISVLLGGDAQSAANQFRAAADENGWTKKAPLANTVGSSTVAAIQAAGFMVMPQETPTFPNHARIISPSGVSGFNDASLTRLSGAFVNQSTPPPQ